MKTRTKFWIIVIIFAVISFALSKELWPDMPGMMAPSAAQLPLFIFLSVMESLAFGTGIAFIFLGLPEVKKLMPESKRSAVPVFIAISWMLVSWWPHDNMHRVNGMNDLGGLLRIEYLFHFTLIIAAFVVAYNFWKLLKRGAVSSR